MNHALSADMRTKWFSRALAGTVVMMVGLGGADTARAQDAWKVDSAHLELGVFGGILHADRKHQLFDRSAVEQQAYETISFDGGARLGVYLTPYFGIEAEGAAMPTSLRDADGDALLYRLGGHAVFQVPGRFSPFLVFGGAAFGVESDEDVQGSDIDSAFYWGVGAKYFLTKNFGVRVDGRQMYAPKVDTGSGGSGAASVHYEALFGLAFAFGRHAGEPADRDGDKIADAVDSCPDKAGIAPDGCPAQDTDGDGVMDRKDACPNVAGKLANGCPADTDGDGVTDDQDKCVDVAGPMADGCPDPDPDRDGVLASADLCPTVASTEPDGCPAQDEDKDGVPDDMDKCPGVKGVAPDGCPPDADNDGVADADDKCVNEPETDNGYQDSDGCPDEIPVEVKKFTGSIKGINFTSGRSAIQPSSFAVLDAAVKVLKEYPDLKVEIGGHTDSSGSAKGNQRLSQKRAESVQVYLIEHGIDADRLTAVGYGESDPVASNRTRAGRAENRRIEFKLIN